MNFNKAEAVNDLQKMRSAAHELDTPELASFLTDIGFECTGCGDCCRGACADNSVIVFPDEVTTIMDTCHLDWNDICEPAPPGFRDGSDTLHSFEWVLNRLPNSDCVFLREEGGCSIHPHRPWICRTYPFYLVFKDMGQAPVLEVSECQGVGRTMAREDALEMARLLKERLLIEIEEEIQTLNQLGNCDDWELLDVGAGHITGKHHLVAVHDSRGIRYL